MKKILILTAAFGDGHNTAARNIRDALEHICNDVKVEVLDLFEASYGPFNTLAKKTYLGIVQYAPRLWESVYSRSPLPIARASGRNGFKIGARTAMSARSWHPIEFARTRPRSRFAFLESARRDPKEHWPNQRLQRFND